MMGLPLDGSLIYSEGGKSMRKGSTWFLILGIIGAILSIYPRFQVERADKNVQIVIDGASLSEYALNHSYTLAKLLPDLKTINIDALAVPELNLWEVAAKRKIVVYPGTYLLLQDKAKFPSIDPRKLYIPDNVEGPVSQRLKLLGKNKIYQQTQLLWEFSEEYPIPKTRRKEAIREPFHSLWEEALYPDLSLIDKAQANEIAIVARIQNPFESNPEVLEYVMSEWEDSPTLIIFQGKEVLGYPSNLKAAAKVLAGKPWGYIEFANQYGEKELARLTNYNLVRVHSITPKEMEKIHPQVAEERYLRAVRERGARVLYMRPFTKLTWEDNLDILNRVEEKLQKEGYILGPAQVKPFFKSSFILFLPVVLAIIIYGMQLALMLGFQEKVSLSLGALALLVIVILYLKGYTILARQVAAFGAAIVFPTLAMGQVIKDIKNGQKKLAYLLIKVLGYTLVGVLFLTASLADLRFVIKTEQFLGVKLMHILPPVLCLWLAVRNLGAGWSKEKIKEFFWPLRWTHVLIFLFVILAGFIYVGRTGHDWGLPIPKLEENLRVYLEKVFVIRPRLKEAFIGHPALFLGLLIGVTTVSSWYLPYLLTIGSIGITSILNTFSHAHTPLLVSLTRTIWGLVIGSLIGVIVFYLLKLTGRKIDRG